MLSENDVSAKALAGEKVESKRITIRNREAARRGGCIYVKYSIFTENLSAASGDNY